MHSEQMKADVFQSGHRQAVRLPAEFRFNTPQVYFAHDAANGTITLSERPLHLTVDEAQAGQRARAEELGALFERIDADGGLNFELERDTRPAEERDWF